MIHKDHGLIVYVDCQPSEQLSYENDVIASFICLVCPQPELFKDYVQYKDTPAAIRPIVAEEIAEKIKVNDHIYCIGTEAKYSHIESTGRKYLKHKLPIMPVEVIQEFKDGYKIDKRKVHSNVANFIPWYSLSLVLIVQKITEIANEIGVSDMVICLDQLPGDNKATMDFIKLILSENLYVNYFKRLKEKYGVTITCANMGSYKDPEGVQIEPKSHPGMVLIDWIAHSIFCANNKEEFIDDGKRDSLYKLSMTQPYIALNKKNAIELTQFGGIVFHSEEDEDFTEQIKEQFKHTDWVNLLED